MKKMMYFAAALLILVGCNKKDNSLENAPKEVISLKGSIELPETPKRIAAPTGWESKTEAFYMLWQEDDQIYIYNTTECEQFTIASGAGNNEASFNGSPLSNMDSYSVAYGYNPQSTSTDYTVPYIEGNYRPFADGTGIADGFSIDNFGPVVGLQLKGEDVTLSKIEIILYGGYDNILGTFTMPFEGGLALNNTTATKVYFPLKNEPAEKMKIRFYENISSVETLIMSKSVSGTKMPEANMVNKYPELVVVPFVPTYVDLGLTSGTKWATCNVGATTPEGYGDYFAWGETAPHQNNDYSSDKYTYTDNPATLPLDHDAANVNWGGNWRMPTKAEQDELRNTDNCTWEWQENYNSTGVKGYLVTSKKNSNSIFLPAAGWYDGSSFGLDGSQGGYWSSSNDNNSSNAYILVFSSEEEDSYNCPRYIGISVRPVCQ